MTKALMLPMLAAALLLCGGCNEDSSARYHEGDIVASKLSGQRGMVIWVSCMVTCRYRVRFAWVSLTIDTHIVGSDGAVRIEPFSVVGMDEYELEPAQ